MSPSARCWPNYTEWTLKASLVLLLKHIDGSASLMQCEMALNCMPFWWWGVWELCETKRLESPGADRRRVMPWSGGIWGEFWHYLQGNQDLTTPEFSCVWLCTKNKKVMCRRRCPGKLKNVSVSVRDSWTLAQKRSSCISPLRNIAVHYQIWWVVMVTLPHITGKVALGILC